MEVKTRLLEVKTRLVEVKTRLRHVMRVMRRHYLTNKKTKTITKTNTFREHLQRATLETCEH